MKSQRSRGVRERRRKSLPSGWAKAAERLANSYLEDRNAIATARLNEAEDRHTVKRLTDHGKKLSAARKVVDELSRPGPAFASVAIAAQRQLGLGADKLRKDLLDEHLDNLAALDAKLATVSQAVEQALSGLGNMVALARYAPGGQPDDAMLALIDRAATEYFKLTGEPPGRSGGDAGVMGNLLREVFARIRPPHRPGELPGPNTIRRQLLKWRKRKGVT